MLSLLILFRAPANLLWYVAILVSEFCWVFFLLLCVLVGWKFGHERYHLATTVVGIAAMFVYLVPLVQAFRFSRRLPQEFEAVFGKGTTSGTPFRFAKVIAGIASPKVKSQTFLYDSVNNLSLNFYSSTKAGRQPLVLVIHGGSWAAGDKDQLPELNSELAKEGYHVAAIDYRLAPAHHFPAPLEDVQTALRFLCERATSLSIDTTNITLLGRSAGGQIALSAAYLHPDSRINGVINFYGPTDMIWGYENPTSPLMLDSRKVMEDYLGGTLTQVPQQYQRSSATETVSAQTPPTLSLYAENDPLVSPRHGNRLAKKLDAYHIPHFALYLPWATHAFDYTLNGPGGQLSTWAVKQFLLVVNKKGGNKAP